MFVADNTKKNYTYTIDRVICRDALSLEGHISPKALLCRLSLGLNTVVYLTQSSRVTALDPVLGTSVI